MTFLINGHEWELHFVDKYSPVLLNKNGKYTLGVTLPEWRTIYLSDKIYGDQLHKVLSHELFHAELTERNVYVPEYIEEVLADIIADNSLEIMRMTNSIHNNLCKYYGKC